MEMTTEDYLLEIEKSIKRWHYVYEHGNSGEPVPDGFTLNIIRNRIACYQYTIKELILEGLLDDVELPALPPEVSNSYIAHYEERMAYVEKFKETVQKTPVYEEFNNFMKNFKATSTKKAFGVDVPDSYKALLLLELKVHGKDMSMQNDIRLIRAFGYKDAMERFMRRYLAEKEDIEAMTELLTELNDNRKDAPRYDLILPRGLGVQTALF